VLENEDVHAASLVADAAAALAWDHVAMNVLVIAATPGELDWVGGADTLVVGIGPVEAAAHTAAHLATHRPDAILHLGIAGARRASGLQIGDVVIGTLSQYSDLAAAVPTTRTIEPDADLLERIGVLLPDAHRLPIATSAYVGGGDCDVEAMEGFGVLRAAAEAGIPAIELRAISNVVEEEDRANWDFPAGLRAVAEAGRVVLVGL
jgi:nucleoside phosphorylase